MAVTSAILAMCGGIAVYLLAEENTSTGQGPQHPGGDVAEAPVNTSTADSVARAVVAGLNNKDLNALLGLTCVSGRDEGRRALTEALPALSPSASPEVRNVNLTFELAKVNEDKPGEATAQLTGNLLERDGTIRPQASELLLLKEGDRWTLCGLNMRSAVAPVSPSRSGKPTVPSRKGSRAPSTVPAPPT